MKYTYRTKPRPHQHKALMFLVRNRGGGLQVPMRYGKTKVAIDFAGVMHKLRERDGDKARFPTRVLVVTVTDGIEVWHNEIETHCAVPYMVTTGDEAPELGGQGAPIPNDRFTPLDGMRKEYVKTNDGLWFRVINFQNLYKREYIKGREWVAVDREDLKRWRPDIVIVDESHHIGNPTAVTSRSLYRLTRRAKHVVLMTGTMFHRKPFYIFGQAKAYDERIFGNNWANFKARISVMGGYGGYQVLRYRNLKWVKRKLKPWVFIQEKVPTLPPVINNIPAPLTGRSKQVYAKMEKDSIVQLAEGRASADIVLTRHLRLQQIAGGWVRTEDKGYVRVGTNKLDIATSRLTEYREQDILKAVVGCRFLPELKDLVGAGKKAGFKVIVFHGGLKKGHERTRRIAAFKNTKEPCLFVTQIAAAREAIDLSSASTMMLYSLTESFIDYDQFTSRIEKFGDKRTLQYDHIIAPGTRDEVTFAALKEKQDVATFIMKDPERVERIVAANIDRKLKETA